jgi:hypothetical protein
VDFTSAGIVCRPSVALQDANILCVHPEDVGKSVCVLAVSNYGEVLNEPSDAGNGKVSRENVASKASDGGLLPDTSMQVGQIMDRSAATIRGGRSWKDPTGCDSVTLCCSQCCSPIGFASLSSPEIWRFWKHRLATSCQNVASEGNVVPQNSTTFPSISSFNESRGIKAIGSVSSFLVREMVRYAESKAIFTFVIGRETHDSRSGGSKCMLLRLLSWETAMARSTQDSRKWESRYSHTNNRVSFKLDFQRVAKLVFEETADRMNPSIASNDDSTAQWTWGGVDLCCPPTVSSSNELLPFSLSNLFKASTNAINETQTGSTVRMELPEDEYDQVLRHLKESRSFFSKTQEDSTILIKMGRERSTGMGLTVVPLL